MSYRKRTIIKTTGEPFHKKIYKKNFGEGRGLVKFGRGRGWMIITLTGIYI